MNQINLISSSSVGVIKAQIKVYKKKNKQIWKGEINS